MEFRILGPLEVREGPRVLRIAGAKQRAVLALLLLHANEAVSTDRLIDEIWDEHAPASGAKAVQVRVAALRKVLHGGLPAGRRDVLVTRPSGYLVSVGPDELDALRFELLVDEGRRALAAGLPAVASAKLREGAALWRGPRLADFTYQRFAQNAIARLEELRLVAVEHLVEADLALGRHHELVPELKEAVARHPLRERLRRALMLALYRSDRQVEALDVYREGRRLLVDELGVEPSPELSELEAAILRQDAALAAPATRRASVRLPSPSSSLIGRDRELDETAALLRESRVRLLTLTGAGGSGKTRLSLALAERLAQDFPDGAAFVELAPLANPATVPATIAQALGLEQATKPLLARLEDYLYDRHLLLVLDNFEHLLGAAPIVARLLTAAPSLKILATSRARLGVSGEHEYPVSPLPVPDPDRLPDLDRLERYDAAVLFIERARAASPGFALTDDDQAAVAEICVRLDGLPLAIELAAARMKMLSPRIVLTRFDSRFSVLGRGPRDVPARQQTLRATIDWSHGLLDDDERGTFAKLSVFSGGFTLDAAETVVGPGPATLDVLGSLVDWNLVHRKDDTAAEPRFGMLETIRQYGMERLTDSGWLRDARQRHAEFFRDLAEQAEPELRGPCQAQWLERLDAESENLRAALTCSIEYGDVALGFRTAAALWRFWQFRGRPAEGREHIERLLARDGPQPTADRARALACAGRLAYFQGEYEPARTLFEEGMAVLRDAGDSWETAFLFANLGMVAQAVGDHVRGRLLLHRGAALFRAIGDAWGEAMAVLYLGAGYLATGDAAEARASLNQSLRLATEAKDARVMSVALTHLGACEREQGHVTQARRCFDEAVTIQRALGDRISLGASLANLAVIAEEQGDFRAAAVLFQETLELRWDAADRPGIAATLAHLASVAASLERQELAARLFGAADALYESLGRRGWPIERSPYEQLVGGVRSTLGEDTFASAWTAGRTMRLDAAVALAGRELA